MKSRLIRKAELWAKKLPEWIILASSYAIFKHLRKHQKWKQVPILNRSSPAGFLLWLNASVWRGGHVKIQSEARIRFATSPLPCHPFSGILLRRLKPNGFTVLGTHLISLGSHSKGWMPAYFKKWWCKNSTPALDTSDPVEQISLCAQKIAIYFHGWNETLSLQTCTHMLSLMRVSSGLSSQNSCAHCYFQDLRCYCHGDWRSK